MIRKEYKPGDTVWCIWCSEVHRASFVARTRKSVCLQNGDELRVYDIENAYDDEPSAVSAALHSLNNEYSRVQQRVTNSLKRLTELATKGDGPAEGG